MLHITSRMLCMMNERYAYMQQFPPFVLHRCGFCSATRDQNPTRKLRYLLRFGDFVLLFSMIFNMDFIEKTGLSLYLQT